MQPMSLWLLHPQPPVLGLSASLQTVAIHALQGDTDRAIAARLGISADAVKQAWRGILKAVSTHMPDLCKDTTGATAEGATPVRGAEHRRVVIEYLRQHMEELRPWVRRTAP
jgi:DNA-binding NarL/FixJ family response regulator